MGGMSVNRSQSQTSVAPKSSAPPRVARTSSAPSAGSGARPAVFKSANATAEPAENKQIENQVQQASCLEMRRNAQLVDTQVNQAIMSDLGPVQAAAPVTAPAAAPSPTPQTLQAEQNQAMAQLQQHFTFNQTEIPVDGKGQLSNQANVMDTMMMRYNPHANRAAKQESEVFRAFAEKENSHENTRFLDETYKLAKMDPHSDAFDQHLDSLHTRFVAASSREEVNLPYGCRQQATNIYAGWQAAQRAHAAAPNAQTQAQLQQSRTAMIQAMNDNTREVKLLARDTWARYSSPVNHFRSDVLRSENRGLFGTPRREVGQEFLNSTRTTGDVRRTGLKLRLREFNDNGRIYREYRRTQRDPHWRQRQARQEDRIRQQVRASGYQRDSIKFGLYRTFVAPWKQWR